MQRYEVKKVIFPLNEDKPKIVNQFTDDKDEAIKFCQIIVDSRQHHYAKGFNGSVRTCCVYDHGSEMVLNLGLSVTETEKTEEVVLPGKDKKSELPKEEPDRLKVVETSKKQKKRGNKNN